jgi:hypothetical protein
MSRDYAGKGTFSGTEISTGYQALVSSISELLEHGRKSAAKSINTVLTTTYWLIGRRLVEYEQGGKERAAYGSELLKRLSGDLRSQGGRGFSERNLEQMRQFYLQWQNSQTLSADSGAAIPPKSRHRMVSSRLALLPSKTAKPHCCRVEARQIHSRRCRTDESLS